jgi:hypothetical protein
MTRREFMITMAVLAATAVILRHVPKVASGADSQPVPATWQLGWQFPWQFGETAAIYLPAVKR